MGTTGTDSPRSKVERLGQPLRPTAKTPAGADRGAPDRVTGQGDEGVCFPVIDGSRSTTAVGRGILADAARAADSELAERIELTSDWRGDYIARLCELTEVSAVSPELAPAIARAGLASMRERMTFERAGQTFELDRALSATEGEPLHTGEISGTYAPVTELRVPYRGRELHGRELQEQLDEWVDSRVVEPSFAVALGRVMEHPEWLALPGRQVAIIGAGAEMGPLEPLTRWGASVIAIDRPVEGIWNRVTDTIRRGAGTAKIPLSADGTPGVDVVRSLPEARTWLDDVAGEDQLVLGMYAYADGGAHVCVTAAADALGTDLLRRRSELALAYLATPTDAFVVPEEVVADAHAAYADRGLRRILQAPLRGASRGGLFAPAYPGTSRVADVLVAQQGPNYALAKRLQRWRGVTASAGGSPVSFNVAPATWTRSVTSNRVLAAAYVGARHFGVEIFPPSTSRVLMAALLVHDLHEPSPAGRDPEALFSDGAAHGGLWRAAYQPRSVLGVAAVTGLHRALRP